MPPDHTGCAQLLVITRDVACMLQALLDPLMVATGHMRSVVTVVAERSRWMVAGRRHFMCSRDPQSPATAVVFGLRLSVAARRRVDLVSDQSPWFIII